MLESVSPASVPRPSWDAAKQRARGFNDEYAHVPVPAYKYKRDVWFARVFSAEAARHGVRKSEGPGS